MARVVFALLMFLVPGASQQSAPSPELTFARFSRSSKEYLRDSAELPMHLTFDLTATNSSGRVIKSRHGAVDYDFHGYNTRSMNGDTAIQKMKSRDQAAVGTAVGAPLVPGMLLLIPPEDAEKTYRMQVLDSPTPEIVIADFVALGECHPKWTGEVYLPAAFCGNSKVQLSKDDLSVKSAAIEINGMPIQGKVDYLGQATIHRCYLIIDFQKVMLPGDPKPFVVPSHVAYTVDTNKGKLVLTAEYALRKK
jgi:hypothetical protein